jgi:hypothetical protein
MEPSQVRQLEVLENLLNRYKKKSILDNLELSGEAAYKPIPKGGVLYGGGRVGYNFPLENGEFNLGLMGGGHGVNVRTPQGRYKESDFNFGGLDARYRNKDLTIGGNISPNNWNMYLRKDF